MMRGVRALEYHWVITDVMDTTVAAESKTYDRIIITDATLKHEYDSADVFYFDKELAPLLIPAKEVSDHYPVYGVFRTDLPDDDPPFACSLPPPFRSKSSTWGYIKHRRLN